MLERTLKKDRTEVLKPDPLTKRPTLSGQVPTLRIPHLTGIPQGSSTVTTRRQPENLSNCPFGGSNRTQEMCRTFTES
ncbi:hypothetical protein ACH4U5_38255 [Streptomyces sp. NPDC020858]|uniref:hypothetical protein n=1 Tax=Streptomyces sp. NPDC020858 TaxID=3365097 RepID=UPI00379999E6